MFLASIDTCVPAYGRQFCGAPPEDGPESLRTCRRKSIAVRQSCGDEGGLLCGRGDGVRCNRSKIWRDCVVRPRRDTLWPCQEPWMSDSPMV